VTASSTWPPLIGLRRLRVERYARGGDCDVYLVDLLPRPAKIGPPGADDVQLRIIVAVPFASGKIVGQRGVQRGSLADALGPAEARQHGPFVRRNGEETQH
jgi:hypothetical protein